ncbi:MAG: class I SAM-dependent methyltransferase [Myxococcota bacterium]
MSQALYDELSELYDLFYAYKDYAAEARAIRDLVHAAGIGDGARLVEAACGTGNHLVHLRSWFHTQGFDLAPGAARIAQSKGLDVRVADMRVHRFGPVDVVLCLFSSLGYVPPDALPAVASHFAEGLRPGGLVVVEPWLHPDRIRVGHMSQETVEGPDLKAVRACVMERPEPRLSRFVYHILVTRPTGVTYHVDPHELWLSTPEELLEVFDRAGFDARWEDPGLTGRGLIVGRKRG